MNRKLLYDLAKNFVEPLLSGAKLQPEPVPSVRRDSLVALVDPCTLQFKAERADDYRFVLRRSQPFAQVRAGQLTESDVVEGFVKVVKMMKVGLANWYKADLRAAFPRRVVAKALCNTKGEEEAVLAAIDQMAAWAGQQYEGKPIPAALGFLPGQVPGTLSLREMCLDNCSAVLSNGFDTMVTCNFGGEVVGHETLDAPEAALVYAPYRLAGIAGWSTPGRIALVLNRAGEILIFRDQQLRFARRAGQWHFLTHTPVITQMGRPDDLEVRKAVYSTCLDASFARTGACIGVVTSGHANDWQEVAVSSKDYLDPAQSPKAKVLAAIVGAKKFQQLDRRLRQELVAIDGATLVDHKGTVLAVGAILKIPGGSAGGGRLAAAKALSTLGLGIKVSQDGRITGFHDANDDPRFMVM
jgi:hypothetical protein